MHTTTSQPAHIPQRRPIPPITVVAAAVLAAATGAAVGGHLLSRRHTRRLHQRIAVLDALAHTDPLTGIPNRRAGLHTLDTAPIGMVGVLDLDKFKSVNDSYGHAVGDALLRLAAHRLTLALRGGGLAARLGGDEFLLLWHQPPTQPAATGRRVLHLLSQPARIAGIDLTPAGSLGIALATPAHTRRQLLVDADHAAIAAKTTPGQLVMHS